MKKLIIPVLVLILLVGAVAYYNQEDTLVPYPGYTAEVEDLPLAFTAGEAPVVDGWTPGVK